tara:strand:- start:1272 stop:2882 length:1611 start_codon:yes stop_codon:yes gene_type:complete
MDKVNEKFNSRRSAVLGLNGLVSTSNPLAANTGLDILKKGGNAIDAAVAAAAVLNVVEPMSTGVGGDVFALIYKQSDNSIKAFNGSGKSALNTNLSDLESRDLKNMPLEGNDSGLSVSVPGAVDAWGQLISEFGKFNLDTILNPAIDIAENGFGVSEVTANYWKQSEGKLSINENCELLPGGKAPKFGDKVILPDLAKTLRGIAENGPSYFYEGELPILISNYVKSFSGWLIEQDFENHSGEWVDPISSNYRGYDIWECPPNGQGIAALIALNIFENFTKYNLDESLKLHYQIEAMKIAFEDCLWYVADPNKSNIPVEKLLSKSYAKQRFSEIDPNVSRKSYEKGNFAHKGDTVYLTVIDGEGNACSFINSLYQSFGTGLVVPGTGIALQNRGALFSLNKNHPNFLMPEKRPFNTIIPCLITKENNLVSSLGVMGGFQQPQGHLQVISNLIDSSMNPQESLDSSRFSINIDDQTLLLEDSFSKDTVNKLSLKGHDIKVKSGFDRGSFGGGQVIIKKPNGVLIGGSDSRKDGLAISY